MPIFSSIFPGNVRQWFVCGLSGVEDLRKRQQEFDDRSGQTSDALLSQLRATVDEALQVLALQNWDSLLAVRRVQQFEINGFQTIADSLCHFRGHVQEIIHLTRIQKGDDYQFDFVPEKPD